MPKYNKKLFEDAFKSMLTELADPYEIEQALGIFFDEQDGKYPKMTVYELMVKSLKKAILTDKNIPADKKMNMVMAIRDTIGEKPVDRLEIEVDVKAMVVERIMQTLPIEYVQKILDGGCSDGVVALEKIIDTKLDNDGIYLTADKDFYSEKEIAEAHDRAVSGG